MSVGCAPWAVRVRSLAPSCSSSRATRRLRIDLERPSRSAARLKAPVSTTRTKPSTSIMSTDERSIQCNTAMRNARLLATLLQAYLRFNKFTEEGMTKVLIIDSAATGNASVSRKLTHEFAEQIGQRAGVTIVHRDIGSD